MGSRLLLGACFSTITAILIGAGASTALAAPAVSDCPTVTAGSGAVNPAPSAGVDWSGCDLTGADLMSADLSGANLSNANLTSANLTLANTDMADFANASLFDANGEGATLTNTNFTGANMAQFMADDLAGADLQDVTFDENTNFSGDGSNFDHVRSGGIKGTTKFLPAQWTLDNGFLIGPGADFSGDDLTGKNFSDQNFSGSDLSGANLTNANLTSVNLTGADLAGTNLTNANLSGGDILTSADIQGAIFKGVTWPHLESGDVTGTPASLPASFELVGGYILGPQADVESASLAGADLQGDNLTGVDFTSADLQNANFTDANLTDAFLDQADLTGVTWSNTICPDGTNSDGNFGTCANNIDDRPPVAAPTISARGGTTGWFTGPVTVIWHWTDSTATINPAKCPARTTSTSQGPAVVVAATCFNALGAEGTATKTFKIDAAPPVVSVTGVASGHVYAVGHAPKPGCHTSDVTSGVATAASLKVITTVSPIVGATGTGMFTATCSGAADKAGNAAAPVSVSYTVGLGFPGFTSPKPGSKLPKSAITVTFRLADAHGKPISATLAAKLGQQHRVQATLAGPSIKTVTAACNWDGKTKFFRCSIKTPSGVKAGQSYRITAAEKPAAGFVTAPALGKAANPETITFK